MKKEVIGFSRLGREIVLMRAEEESGVLLVGGIHAREYITCDLAKRLATEEGADCIPCLNPDGRAIVLGEEQPRIDFSGDVRLWKANACGVDLNVNFDAEWGTGEKNVRKAGSENYVGPYPESEPETRAVCDLLRRHFYPVVVSYHTLGEEVYHGFGNNFLFRREAERYASYLGYELKESVGSAGGLKDWYCKNFNGLGLTVEVGKSSWGHPCPPEKLGELLELHRGSVTLLGQMGGEIVRKNDERSAPAGKDRL